MLLAFRVESDKNYVFVFGCLSQLSVVGFSHFLFIEL